MKQINIVKAACLCILILISSVVKAQEDNYYNLSLDNQGNLVEFTYTPPSVEWQGCSAPETEFFVVSSTLPDPVTIETVILKDKDNIPDKWDVSSFPYIFLRRFRTFFNEGNVLKVTYRSCGSAGYPTFVKASIVSKSQLKQPLPKQ